MKKILLSALLLAGAASMNAKEVVVFSEDFEWIEPWLGKSVVDNIGLNDQNTATPRYETIQNEDGVYLRNALWDKGYWFYGVKSDGNPEGSLGGVSVYAARNYLKFGKTNVQTNFRFNPTEDAPADAAVMLEFDWCPWKNGAGVYDVVSIQIEIAEGNKASEVAEVIPVAKWEDNQKFEWQHAVIDLDGFSITKDTRVLITLSDDLWGTEGVHRYCIDNIKMYYLEEESADDSTVFFSDNFNWLEPWVNAYGLGDPVGTNNPNAERLSIADETATLGEGGRNIFQTMMDPSLVADPQYKREDAGYKTRIYPSAAAYYSFIAYDGYLRIGSDGHTGGLRTPEIAVSEDETELYLEFDWCPVFEDGAYHQTQLQVTTRPGDVQHAVSLTHDLKAGDAPCWKHECIDLFENPGTVVGDKFNCMIENIAEQQGGKFNYYIDNIRISNAKGATSGISGVIVDNDSDAEVEYYNLQGVRVANPENGLYIRRQGKSVSKCYIR